MDRARRPRRTRGSAAWDLGFRASRLLEQAGVATLSGTAFGAAGEGHLRLSYANSEENLREGLARIASFVGAL